ncbi:MAG: hypothetical protein R3C01_06760 [Planctomycetaceae bacterium]
MFHWIAVVICFASLGLNGVFAAEPLIVSGEGRDLEESVVSSVRIVAIDSNLDGAALESVVTGARVRLVADVRLPQGDLPRVITTSLRPSKQATAVSRQRFAARTELGREEFPTELSEETSWSPANIVRVRHGAFDFDPKANSVHRLANGAVRVSFVIQTTDIRSLLLLGPGRWSFEVNVQEERTVPPSRPGGEPRAVYVTLGAESTSLIVADDPREVTRYFALNDQPVSDSNTDDFTTIGKSGSLEVTVEFPGKPTSTPIESSRTEGLAKRIGNRWVVVDRGMRFEATVVEFASSSNSKGPAPEENEEAQKEVLGSLRKEVATELKGLSTKPEAVTVSGVFDATDSEVVGGVWERGRAVARVRTMPFEHLAVRISVVGNAETFRLGDAKLFLDSLQLLSVDPVPDSETTGEQRERP